MWKVDKRTVSRFIFPVVFFPCIFPLSTQSKAAGYTSGKWTCSKCNSLVHIAFHALRSADRTQGCRDRLTVHSVTALKHFKEWSSLALSVKSYNDTACDAGWAPYISFRLGLHWLSRSICTIWIPTSGPHIDRNHLIRSWNCLDTLWSQLQTL